MRTKATVGEGIKPCCHQKNLENRAQKPAAMDSCFGLVRLRQLQVYALPFERILMSFRSRIKLLSWLEALRTR